MTKLLALALALGLTLGVVGSAFAHTAPYTITGPTSLSLTVGHVATVTWVAKNADGSVVSDCTTSSDGCPALITTSGTNWFHASAILPDASGQIIGNDGNIDMSQMAVGTYSGTVKFPVDSLGNDTSDTVTHSFTLTVHS